MKVKGLDRVAIMVRDIDKAVGFFSQKLGIKFKELSQEISAREGVRCFVSLDHQLEIVSPLLPLPDNAPPPLIKRVELLKEKELIFLGLTFLVDDPSQAATELKQQGIGIQHEYKESHDYVSIGMDNFVQVVANDQDTLDMVIGFAKYDRVETL